MFTESEITQKLEEIYTNSAKKVSKEDIESIINIIEDNEDKFISNHLAKIFQILQELDLSDCDYDNMQNLYKLIFSSSYIKEVTKESIIGLLTSQNYFMSIELFSSIISHDDLTIDDYIAINKLLEESIANTTDVKGKEELAKHLKNLLNLVFNKYKFDFNSDNLVKFVNNQKNDIGLTFFQEKLHFGIDNLFGLVDALSAKLQFDKQVVIDTLTKRLNSDELMESYIQEFDPCKNEYSLNNAVPLNEAQKKLQEELREQQGEITLQLKSLGFINSKSVLKNIINEINENRRKLFQSNIDLNLLVKNLEENKCALLKLKEQEQEQNLALQNAVQESKEQEEELLNKLSEHGKKQSTSDGQVYYTLKPRFENEADIVKNFCSLSLQLKNLREYMQLMQEKDLGEVASEIKELENVIQNTQEKVVELKESIIQLMQEDAIKLTAFNKQKLVVDSLKQDALDADNYFARKAIIAQAKKDKEKQKEAPIAAPKPAAPIMSTIVSSEPAESTGPDRSLVYTNTALQNISLPALEDITHMHAELMSIPGQSQSSVEHRQPLTWYHERDQQRPNVADTIPYNQDVPSNTSTTKGFKGMTLGR